MAVLKQPLIDIRHGTIAQVLDAARGGLVRALVVHGDSERDEARHDAEVLLRETLGCSRSWLIAHGNDLLPKNALAPLIERLRRRAEGQPIAYITGQREFWSLPLAITNDVLIPRADTELLVECALALLPQQSKRTVCDLGTGSGAVALAIASERPQATIIASDASLPALKLAQHNARQLSATLSERQPHFIGTRWLAAFANDSLHLIVGNPPYIRSDDPHLARGDLRFEPLQALAAGLDGLDDLRAIIAEAPRCLRVDGWLALEHGYDQAHAVRALLAAQNFEQIRTCTDLAGHERVSLAHRPHRAGGKGALPA
ncbi:MAG: release factor glutamine methyltransferase [Gammaproteobacteria bacterium]|jgi:release factor glutamine methyltransferase